MARRKPIDYKPQFGGGIFRPRDEVAEDLETLESAADQEPTELTNQRSNERTNVISPERLKIRHSFDVFKDQITALAVIQSQIFTSTGKKPKFGELVQEALDDYIAKQQARMNERTNERKRR